MGFLDKARLWWNVAAVEREMRRKELVEEMSGQKTRKFGNRVYELHGTFRSKKAATDEAKKLRSWDIPTRITQRKRNGVTVSWQVWTFHGKMARKKKRKTSKTTKRQTTKRLKRKKTR